jgi:hypothetical protein
VNAARISTFGGYETALIAAAKLNAGLGDAARVPGYRAALIASLERLHQAGCGPWIAEWLEFLNDERCWLPIWEADGHEMVKTLGALLNLDEMALELPCPRSVPITPPPSVTAEADEHAAARDTRDTLPPLGDVELWDLEKTLVPV